jgi:two-component system OmpR family response regulator
MRQGPDQSAAEGTRQAPKLHVLVVDDEPAILRMLDLVLQQRGFDVTTAAGGAEAVELYRRRPGVFALVLLDVQMPDPDGPETLAALRTIDPHVRCCFMSGYTGEYSVEQLLALGAAHVFEKPLPGLAELAEKLRDVACSP